MTWFLTVSAITLWLFRKWISRKLAPVLPDQRTRHHVLTLVIVAFVIVAVVRLGARFVQT